MLLFCGDFRERGGGRVMGIVECLLWLQPVIWFHWMQVQASKSYSAAGKTREEREGEREQPLSNLWSFAPPRTYLVHSLLRSPPCGS